MTGHDEALWEELLGGYRVPYDPRPAIARLGLGDPDGAWDELWNELHHQGDVDSASYAAVPELVSAYERAAAPDWNVYALIGTIELQRGIGKNPDVQTRLAARYHGALARLAELAHQDLKRTDDPLVARSALGILAIAKNIRSYARLLLELDESEVAEILDGG